MVGFASAGVALTAPGQTAAVSVFIDPMTADLGISRSAVSTAYLIGTLTGAFALPFIGKLIDRHGVRITMAGIGAVFGAALVGLSVVTEIVGLTSGFVGIRMAGQGALGLAASTVVSLWFRRKRGAALGVVNGVGAGFISLSPVLLEQFISASHWRTAWLLEGLAIWALVIPIALWGMRNRPEDVGQHVDGMPSSSEAAAEEVGLTRAQALRAPFFWVLAGCVATTGMLATAVGFHQISLLGERGLSSTEAAANFLPQTVAGIAATMLMGVLMDRLPARLLICASMATLGFGLAWATFVAPGWSALGFGLTLGAAGNAIRTIEAAMTPRVFGTAHLGAIRGVITALSVASTAFGPLLFALVHDATGSYSSALWGSTALPALIVVAALTAPLPQAALIPR